MYYPGQILRISCDNTRFLEWLTNMLVPINVDCVDLQVDKTTKVSLCIPGKLYERNVVFGRAKLGQLVRFPH